MELSDFDFYLPPELIAQQPAEPRNSSKLLVYDRKTRAITDDYFYNLDKYLEPQTTLVLNNSKVDKCRLLFGKTEIFALETIDPQTIKALVRPGRLFKLNQTTKLDLGEGILQIETADIDDSGIRTLKLSIAIDDTRLDKYRLTPLPPYIKQDEALAEKYQTVFSKTAGSKAAPTAGLHFTNDQLTKLIKSHAIVELTLHVGLGTFLPVKTQKIADHKMHAEIYELTRKAADQLNQAKHITAVGTTSARTLESLNRPFVQELDETSIFITPGYKFRNVDALITNFHLPKSTLLMLVAAHIGSVDELHRIYQHAIKNNYRFYSFGDAMLSI